MKNAVSILTVITILCSVVVAFAWAGQDFSGTWILDKDRSYSNPPGLEQTISIVHTGEMLKLDAELKTAQGKQAVQESWVLDGQEREFAPSGVAPGTRAKGKASWLPGKRGILIVDERTVPSQNGSVTQQTMRKFSLASDGATLTIDYYFDTPRGQYEAKRVFSRKSGAN